MRDRSSLCGTVVAADGEKMSDDFGSNYAPQRTSETDAEYRERTGSESSSPIRPAPSKVRKPGGSEWILGLGGPILILLGWIISGTASAAFRESSLPVDLEVEWKNAIYGSNDPSVFLAWQAFGSTMSWIGFGLAVIMISIRAAVSTYFRHLDRR